MGQSEAEVLVTLAGHFLRAPDGHAYAPSSTTAYPFWRRYLSAFDRVAVAARVSRVDTVPAGLPRADGPNVRFCDLPDYHGPWQYLTQRGLLRRRLAEAVDQADVFCLRVPCPIGTLAAGLLKRRGRPFGIEVVGDPWDSLGPGTVRSIVRPLARRAAARDLRRLCRQARISLYVTRDALQQRYPPAPGRPTVGCSDVDLSREAVVDTPRIDFRGARRIIFVGTLEVLYKAPDVLIRAVAACGRAELHLTLVGEGRRRRALETLARSLGMNGQIRFTGQLANAAAVRQALDAADLYILPSRQEGLPRAMLEAMARSLPCIGSTVGGIPELLPQEDRVPPDDVQALTRKIIAFLDNPRRMAIAAERNWRVAQDYSAALLAERRTAFYTQLRQFSSDAAR